MFNTLTPIPEEKKEIVQEIADNLRTAFKTGGLDVHGNLLHISDALHTPDSQMAIQRVITEIIQESVEPTLIGTMLLDQMYTTDRGISQVTIRTLGSLANIDFTIAEGAEYPEVGLNRGQQNVLSAVYGKYGLKLCFSEEMLQSSQWNFIEKWVNKAVAALGRFKERKIFDMLLQEGTVVFDNVNPTAAEIGRTQGRDIYGNGNGSLTTGDLVDMYSYLLTQGYIPNVILLHPLHWALFAKDPILREAGLARGDISQWVQSQVNPINPYKYITGWTDVTKGANGDCQRLTNEERNVLEKTAPTIPSYASPLSGLTLLVSDLVPYNEAAKTADIIMLDTRNTGVLVTNEPLSLQEWDQQSNDMKYIKLRERYALAVYEQGRAIAIAKNISLEPNEIFNNPQIVIENLSPIPRK